MLLTKSEDGRTSKLFLEVKFLYNRIIALLVVTFEVFKVSTTVRNHLEEPTAGVLIVVMLLEVGGKLVNTLGKEGNLHFRRAAIRLVDPDFLHNLLLFSLCQHIVTVAQLRPFCKGSL